MGGNTPLYRFSPYTTQRHPFFSFVSNSPKNVYFFLFQMRKVAVVVIAILAFLLLYMNKTWYGPDRRVGAVVHAADIAKVANSHNKDILKQVFLKEFSAPHLIFLARAVFLPGHNAPGHSHKDMDEVFYVESGEGTFVINGKEHLLTKGDTAHVAVSEVHDISNKGTEDLVLVYFGLRP